MGIIKKFFEKIRGVSPVRADDSVLAVGAVSASQGQQTVATPQPPVPSWVHKTPQTLAEAIEYVQMGDPVNPFDDSRKWHEVCTELRAQYKTHTLNLLEALLKTIRTNSPDDTEAELDAALLKLGTKAPVKWTIDRRMRKDYSDGSRCYVLLGHRTYINANGAFAVTNLDRVIWVQCPSLRGTAFVLPPP